MAHVPALSSVVAVAAVIVNLLDGGIGLSDASRLKRTSVRFYSRPPHTARAPASPMSTTP